MGDTRDKKFAMHV